MLKSFFENPDSELWLFFLRGFSTIFHQVALKIEGQNEFAIEAANEINQL